jgi:proton-dependent oligopeptide transporter, POT family
VIFWSGRHRYVHVPPTPPDPHSFMRVLWSALVAPGTGSRPGLALAGLGAGLALAALSSILWLGPITAPCLALVFLIGLVGGGAWIQLDRARGSHPEKAIDGARSVLRILVAFALVTPFWSLFDQKASTWVLQGAAMTKPSWFEPAQMQALNPALVLILIPLNNLAFFPLLRRLGIEPTPLRRMTAGIGFAGLAWIAIGVMQLVMDAGTPMSITWQILPYFLLTTGEVLVSATGLEFAYSQAPPSMKGAIMSFWYLSVTIGNVWVLLANATVRNEGVIARIQETGISVTAFLMFFFAGFALLAAFIFGLHARRYPLADNYREA